MPTERNTSKERDQQPPSLQDALADYPLIVMLSDDDTSKSTTEKPPIMSPTDQSNVKNETNVGASQAPPIQPITCSVTVSNLPKIPFMRSRCSEDTEQDNQKNSEEMKKAICDRICDGYEGKGNKESTQRRLHQLPSPELGVWSAKMNAMCAECGWIVSSVMDAGPHRIVLDPLHMYASYVFSAINT